MGFVDLGSYLDDDAVDTPPIASTAHPDGRSYRIPSPDAKTGVRLTAMVSLGIDLAVGAKVSEKDAEKLQIDDDAEPDFLREVLGSAYDEMLTDGVSWMRIQRLGRYFLLYFTLGPEAAADEAKRASSGEAPAPNRETRRAKATSSRASSATARSTRSRGSTATTSSPRKRATKS